MKVTKKQLIQIIKEEIKESRYQKLLVREWDEETWKKKREEIKTMVDNKLNDMGSGDWSENVYAALEELVGDGTITAAESAAYSDTIGSGRQH